jgi:hypothetical protein
MNFITDTIDLEALLYALAQQPDSLPPALQASLTKIGRDLETNPSEEKAIELRELIKSDESLELAYQNGLVAIDRAYNAKERTKGLNSISLTGAALDNLFSKCILVSSDWVSVAKQLPRDLNAHPQSNPTQFWDKTDRIAVMTVGGAALGGAVAQLPGAIIGGLFAAGYGWYIGFGQTKTSRDA